MNVLPLVDDHSPFGPSSIEAVILCPGRVRMQTGIDDHTSFPAAQGTVAHGIGEKKLKKEKTHKSGSTVIEDGYEIQVDGEMLKAVAVYTRHINRIRKQPADLFYREGVEKSGSLKFLGLPEVWGTSDYSLAVPFSALVVRDYKHGKGVMVSPEHNPQLMCYALIAAQELIWTYDTVDLGVVQPRTREGKPIKTWETTPGALLDWVETKLRPAIELARTDDAPLIPGEKQCQWCRAFDFCPAVKRLVDMAQALAIMDAGAIKWEQIEEIYPHFKMITKWIESVSNRVYNHLDCGRVFKGHKMVLGRNKNYWGDEAEALEMMHTREIAPFEKKMLTPAKVKKLIGSKAFKDIESLVETSNGRPQVVKATDKRPAINSALEDFKEFKPADIKE